MLFADAGLSPAVRTCVESSLAKVKAHIRQTLAKDQKRVADIAEVKRMGLWEFPRIKNNITKWTIEPGRVVKNAKLFVNAGIPINIHLIPQSERKIKEFIKKRIAEYEKMGAPLVYDVDAVFERLRLMKYPGIKAAVKANSSRWLIASKALLFEQAKVNIIPKYVLRTGHGNTIRRIAKAKAA
jgi:hypothetical protein